jgi:hypothetical protein
VGTAADAIGTSTNTSIAAPATAADNLSRMGPPP